MLVTWSLFELWLVLSLLDLTVSGLAIHFGARQVGLIFQFCQDWHEMCFIKGIGAFLFGMILVTYKRKALLGLSCAIYSGVCVYNGLILWRQIGG